MKIGKASYGGGNKKTYFKMKDGDNTYRILPPMGELADKGIWSVFYNVHYGYKNSEGKLRPFQSPLVKNYKTKMIEVPDAALERIEKLKSQLEAAKKSGNAALVAKLNEFVGPKGSFNLDNNHYVNAIDAQGNIGILKLRHRAKQALDVQIKKLREAGVDPLSVDNGRYFVINRTGTGLDTAFSASVLTQKIVIDHAGQKMEVQKDVVHVLDEPILNRLATEAANLGGLFKKPTSEEVAQIVAEGATAIDRIIDGKGAPTAGSAGGEEYDDSGDYADESGTQAQSASSTVVSGAVTTASIAQSVAPTTTSTMPVAVSAPVVAPQVSAPVTIAAAPAVTTTAAQVSDLSDADFLKSLGI